MKIMVASDIHGSSYYCEKMLRAFAAENASRLLLLGDILYHGPRNDLPRGYNPKLVIEMLNEQKTRIFCVRGNCDTEVDQMVLNFPILADYCLLNIGGRLVYATHGHNFNKNKLPPLCEGDILLHGHTHVPAWEKFGCGNMYINPGSVSIPKENSEHSYITIEDETIAFKNLDGEVYHTLSVRDI